MIQILKKQENRTMNNDTNNTEQTKEETLNKKSKVPSVSETDWDAVTKLLEELSEDSEESRK